MWGRTVFTVVDEMNVDGVFDCVRIVTVPVDKDNLRTLCAVVKNGGRNGRGGGGGEKNERWKQLDRDTREEWR